MISHYFSTFFSSVRHVTWTFSLSFEYVVFCLFLLLLSFVTLRFVSFRFVSFRFIIRRYLEVVLFRFVLVVFRSVILC